MTSSSQALAVLPSGRGAFITMEGGEGAGKSTQCKALARRLRDAGFEALTTREPGGSPKAELIREALLAGTFKSLGTETEAMLFAAARIDHLDATIRPALGSGTWVVCDRFHDSTRAYQGALGSVDAKLLDTLERVTLNGVKPDLTLILDLPAKAGLLRAAMRRAPNAEPDRYEAEPLEFHLRLRDAFLDIAAREPDRCAVIDAAAAPDMVEEAIWAKVAERFGLG